MNLRKLILTKNAVYKAGRTIKPKGIMVHSTGAYNPSLNRYVGPDDGLLGVNRDRKGNVIDNHWNRDRPDGRFVCVHAFIGLLGDEETIATYQTLPWNYRGSHCGHGPKGSGNETHISFEICEDNLAGAAYFAAVYKEAVELCAHLCGIFNFNPAADGAIIGHFEGHKRGIASNHSDPHNWFPRHGKSMDTFRRDVAAALAAAKETEGDMVTQAQFEAMFDEMMRGRAAKPPAEWAEEPWAKAKKKPSAHEPGRMVMDGTNPQGYITRQEHAATLYRLGLL